LTIGNPTLLAIGMWAIDTFMLPVQVTTPEAIHTLKTLSKKQKKEV
jgi:hypothetical protein